MIGVLPEPQISTPNPTPCFRHSTLSLKTTSQVAVLFFPKTLGRCQFQLWVHACFLSLWSLTQGSPSGGPLNAYGGLLGAAHLGLYWKSAVAAILLEEGGGTGSSFFQTVLALLRLTLLLIRFNMLI